MSEENRLEKQRKAIERMREELDGLNREFESLKAKLGVKSDDELKIDPDKVPPEVAEAMARIKARAEEDGKAAASRLTEEMSSTTSGSTGVRRSRRGAIRI